MVKHLSEHRRKTDLYLKILNRALQVNDPQLACIVRNKLKHHHHQDYAVATPTGGVIIRLPQTQKPSTATVQRPAKAWVGWVISLCVFPGSLLAMLGFTLYFS